MSLSPQASVNQPKVTSYAKTSKFAPDVKNSTTIRNVNEALDALKINELNTPRLKSIQTQQAQSKDPLEMAYSDRKQQSSVKFTPIKLPSLNTK